MGRADELYERARKDPVVSSWSPERVRAYCEYIARAEGGGDVRLADVFAERGLKASGWTYGPLKEILRVLGLTLPAKRGRRPRGGA
ncbi:MAG: hypothetical protein JRN54_04845 [Nitrososphaerota archaeon]|nr:hypothetical protein [Nitrososphaerota archaeon]